MTAPANRWTPPLLPRDPAAALDVLTANLKRLDSALPEVPKRYRYRLASAATTLADTDDVLLVDTGSGSVTVTLPDAETYAGRRFAVVKTAAANTLTWAASGSDTVNGAASGSTTTQWSGAELTAVRTALPATYSWIAWTL